MSTPEEREQDRLAEELVMATEDRPTVWVRHGKRVALLPARAGDPFVFGQLARWYNGEVTAYVGDLIGEIVEGPE
jgi:hypothetical protein